MDGFACGGVRIKVGEVGFRGGGYVVAGHFTKLAVFFIIHEASSPPIVVGCECVFEEEEERASSLLVGVVSFGPWCAWAAFFSPANLYSRF